jgi:thiamine biosynthesis lipoprotein
MVCLKKNLPAGRFKRGALLFCSLLLSSCGASPLNERVSKNEFVLGTLCTITLYERASPRLFDAAFDRLRELEDILSANKAGSDLDRVNSAAGTEAVRVRPELVETAERALHYARLSGGAFDPTVGPLVKLWNIGFEGERVPSQSELEAALPLVNWRGLEIDREEGRVFLRQRGAALDLGGIAKGYAADEAVTLLRAGGVSRGIVDLGGNIFVFGAKDKKGSPWSVGVQDPLKPRGNYLGILKVVNKSVVTTGVYERFFEEEGERYHHVLSTVTGRPVNNGLLSVTIAADASIDADALSTAVFALGHEQGRALLEAVPGAGAVFVFGDKSAALAGEIGNAFTLTAEDYVLTDGSPGPPGPPDLP